MRITFALCLFATSSLSWAVNSQTQYRNEVLSFNGPRPLSDAAIQLQSKLKVPISYEDVALVYSGDYARALDTDWGRAYAERDARFKASNPIGSRGGSLEIRFGIDSASGKPVMISQILHDVIDQHKARGNPGEFKLLAIGNGFVIVPTAKRDGDGSFIPEQSPLDSLISFPVAKRTGAETLQVICEAVTNASGRRVWVGMAPKLLFNTVVELGAEHETARNVLGRAMPKMSWLLLYGPSRLMTTTPMLTDGSYALNLRSVQ